MEERGWTLAELQRQLDSALGLATRHLYGDQLPGLSYLLKYQEILKVKIEDWSRPPTEEFIPPALRDHAEQGANDSGTRQGVNGSAADSGAT